MTIYNKFQDLADKLLDPGKFGSIFPDAYEKITVVSEDAYGEKVVEKVSYSVKGLKIPFRNEEVGASTQSTVLYGDIKFYMSAKNVEFVPKVNDILVLDGIKYRIIQPLVVEPTNVKIIYKLHLRVG